MRILSFPSPQAYAERALGTLPLKKMVAVDFLVSRLPAHMRAPAYMIVACVAFAALWGLVRLASETMHAFLVVFYRNLFGLLALLPALIAGGRAGLATSRFGTHVRRATSGVIATFATFYAVANAPMATVMAINYTIPLFATLAAILFLKERVRWRRMAALLVGFIGMLIVVRPGHLPLTPGIGAALLAAVATAFSIIAMKQLSRTETSLAVVTYSFVLMLPPSLLVALPYWQWPSWQELLVLAGVGLAATIGQSGTVKAFALAEATAVLPYDFVRFGLVICIGTFAFGDPVDAFTYLGGAVILCATIYIAHREAVAARRARPASTPREA